MASLAGALAFALGADAELPASVAAANPAPSDYGTDLGGVTDLDSSFGAVSGGKMLAECIARGFMTPAGSLDYAPQWGYDVRDHLNDATTQPGADAMRAGMQAQAERDERVSSAAVSISYVPLTQTLLASVEIAPVLGQSFTLTLAITDVTVAILNGP